MPNINSEERYPLLAFIVTEDELNKNNKRFFQRRFDGITSGATNVIAEWPNYMGTCWLTTLLCALSLFVLSLLMVTVISSQSFARLPRCPHYEISNQTIHLIKNKSQWEPHQLELIGKLLKFFPKYKILLSTVEIDYFNYHSQNIYYITQQTDNNDNSTVLITRRLLEKIEEIHQKNNRTKIQKLITNSSDVPLEIVKYKTTFLRSPFFWKWSLLSQETKDIVSRILLIWEFGGLSFDLDLIEKFDSIFNKKNESNKNISLSESNINDILDLFILDSKFNYESLGNDKIVIDNDAYYFGSKIQCHSFFGKVLMNLMKNPFGSVRAVLKHNKDKFKKFIVGHSYKFLQTNIN